MDKIKRIRLGVRGGSQLNLGRGGCPRGPEIWPQAPGEYRWGEGEGSCGEKEEETGLQKQFVPRAPTMGEKKKGKSTRQVINAVQGGGTRKHQNRALFQGRGSNTFNLERRLRREKKKN